jgi:hypothetical protein
MKLPELYVQELLYLCLTIERDQNEWMKIGDQEIAKYKRNCRLMPWRKNHFGHVLSIKLQVVNKNMRFRTELMRKLQSSTGGGNGENLTLSEILEKGGDLFSEER